MNKTAKDFLATLNEDEAQALLEVARHAFENTGIEDLADFIDDNTVEVVGYKLQDWTEGK